MNAFGVYFDFKFKSQIELNKWLNQIFYTIDYKSDHINDHNIKLSLDLNKDGNEFSLFVNGRNVYALPYFYDKFTQSLVL